MRIAQTLVLATLLGTTSAAASESCPLTTSDRISVTMTQVTVAKRTYRVAGPSQKERFHSLLLTCGFDRSAETYMKWRALRMTTNVSFGASALLLIPPVTVAGALGLGLVTPAFGLSAGANRRTFRDALYADITKTVRDTNFAVTAPDRQADRRASTTCADVGALWDAGHFTEPIQTRIARAHTNIQPELQACLEALEHPDQLTYPNAFSSESEDWAVWKAAGLPDNLQQQLASENGVTADTQALVVVRARVLEAERRILASYQVIQTYRDLAQRLDTTLPNSGKDEIARVRGLVAEAEAATQEAHTEVAHGLASIDLADVRSQATRLELRAATIRHTARDTRRLLIQAGDLNRLATTTEVDRAAREVWTNQQVDLGNALIAGGVGVVGVGAAVAIGAAANELPRNGPCRATPFRCGGIEPEIYIPGGMVAAAGVGLSSIGFHLVHKAAKSR